MIGRFYLSVFLLPFPMPILPYHSGTPYHWLRLTHTANKIHYSGIICCNMWLVCWLMSGGLFDCRLRGLVAVSGVPSAPEPSSRVESLLSRAVPCTFAVQILRLKNARGLQNELHRAAFHSLRHQPSRLWPFDHARQSADRHRSQRANTVAAWLIGESGGNWIRHRFRLEGQSVYAGNCAGTVWTIAL